MGDVALKLQPSSYMTDTKYLCRPG